ncbi:hypothetical protein [Noviherbaspirillum sp.]|nr:hypothetical protein [Noviherbaspirillum sp.]HZW22321.1 hypothetical protein [Noviherbaspirillum sp.]
MAMPPESIRDNPTRTKVTPLARSIDPTLENRTAALEDARLLATVKEE